MGRIYQHKTLHQSYINRTNSASITYEYIYKYMEILQTHTNNILQYIKTYKNISNIYTNISTDIKLYQHISKYINIYQKYIKFYFSMLHNAY